jgi:hypothetical protein
MRGGDIPINPENEIQNNENDNEDNDYIAPPTVDDINAAFEQLQHLGFDYDVTEIALTHYPITIEDLVNIYLDVAQEPPYNRNWEDYTAASNAPDDFTINGITFNKSDIANETLHFIGENIEMRPEMRQQTEGDGQEDGNMEIEGGKRKKHKRKTRKTTRKRHSKKIIKKTKRRKTHRRRRH